MMKPYSDNDTVDAIVPRSQYAERLLTEKFTTKIMDTTTKPIYITIRKKFELDILSATQDDMDRTL